MSDTMDLQKQPPDLALLVDFPGPVPKRRVSRIMKKNGETKRTAGDAQTDPALPHKTIALIEIALNAASAGLQSDDTRSSIRVALEAGATREEILIVLKMASGMSIAGRSLRADRPMQGEPLCPCRFESLRIAATTTCIRGGSKGLALA